MRASFVPGTRWSTRTPSRRPGAGLELGDDAGEVVDAVHELDDDALDAQVVAPDLLDELGVVPALDVDARAARHPGARAVDRHRAARGPRGGAPRVGERAVAARRGGVSVTGAPSTRKPGPEREALVRPRRSSRCTTCMPPAFSTRTTAPTQPVSTSSTTRSGSAASRRGRPRRGATPVAAEHVGSVAIVGGHDSEGMPRACRRATPRGRGRRAVGRSRPAAYGWMNREIGGARRRLGTRRSRVPDGETEVDAMSEDRRLDGAARHRAGLRPDLRAGRQPRRSSSATTSGSRAATVRNDMAVLEEEGLIHAPHTVGGPGAHRRGLPRCSSTGLSAVKPLSPAERRAIEQFLDGRRRPRRRRRPHRAAARPADPAGRGRAVPVADPVDGAPHRARADGLPHRLMIVLIINTGRVEQRVVDTDAPVDATVRRSVASICARDQRGAAGVPFTDAGDPAARPRRRRRRADRAAVAAVVRAARRALVEEREERVVLGRHGQPRPRPARLPLSIGPVLEALEEHVVLLRLLGAAATTPGVSVRIGAREPREGLPVHVVVSIGLRPGAEASPASGCSARPAWTTPRRWQRSAPSPATSRPSCRPESRRCRQDTRCERLLRRPRRPPRREPGGDQEGLPPARPQAAPGREPEPGGRGGVQAGLPGLRRALRPAEAPVLRHGRRPVRHGRRRGGFGPAASSFSDIMDAFFGGGAGRHRAARARAPSADRTR